MKKGQTLVEFALVFVVFLTVIMGIIDWGIYLHSLSTVSSATRDAARTAATYPDLYSNPARDQDIIDIVVKETASLPKNSIAGIGVTENHRISINRETTETGAPSFITVKVVKQPYIPFVGFLSIAVPKYISTEATMRYERR